MSGILFDYVVQVIAGLSVIWITGSLTFGQKLYQYIRKCLQNRPSLFRSFYTWRLINAIRRRSQRDQLARSNVLLCFIAVFLGFSLTAGIICEKMAEIFEWQLLSLQAISTQVNLNSELVQSVPTDTQGNDERSDALKNYTAKMDSLTERLPQVDQKLDITLAVILLGSFVLFLLYALSVVRLKLTADFEVELVRLKEYLTLLASKSELATLLELESKVKDQESLKFYLEQISNIAQRHNVEAVLESFPSISNFDARL